MQFDHYLQIPWECGKRSHKSADCWGLVLLVLEEQFNIILDHMKDIAVSDTDEVSKVMADSIGLEGWEPVDKPKAGDVVMLFTNNAGKSRPEHVGIMVDERHVLHSFSREGGLSAIHSIRVLSRLFNHLEFHRHATRNSL